MPAHRGHRTSPETGMQDLSSLSSTLARVQRIASFSSNTMARKIGFTLGLELASGNRRSSDLYSELRTIFRRLSLGNITLRKWGPVVFVTHNNSKESLEFAFGEGMLEGVAHARSEDQVFFKHSTCNDKSRSNSVQGRSHEKARRGSSI